MFKQLMCGSDERLIDRFRVEITEFFATFGISCSSDYVGKSPC
jgi:hypothetical protein